MVTPIILIAVATGFYTGTQTGITQIPNDETITQFYIDGYEITFLPGDHPKMKGHGGFTYNHIKNDIYINSNLSINQIESICNHEYLHELGVPESKDDFIEKNQDELESELCSKLKKRVKKARSFRLDIM